jgi:hypothetical protein
LNHELPFRAIWDIVLIGLFSMSSALKPFSLGKLGRIFRVGWPEQSRKTAGWPARMFAGRRKPIIIGVINHNSTGDRSTYFFPLGADYALFGL